MALVFVSHAHGDEVLVRKVVALLRDGLNLGADDFFVSSQGGRGVAPAAKIRDEILKELPRAASHVVLVTPKSVGSPWVWLEAGDRLGSADKSNPIFAVPAERLLALVQPVADLRCLRLDNEEDALELVKAVGENLGRQPQNVLNYSAALRDLNAAVQSAFSPMAERRDRAVAWIKAQASALLLAAVALAGIVVWYRSQVEELNRKLDEVQASANEAVNEEISRTAARYLILRGVVESGQRPVAKARVAASWESDALPDCEAPKCTFQSTTSAGEFKLDLTKIRAQNGDDIVLTVTAPGFEVFTKQVRVDVRAIDVGVPSHIVALKPTQ